MRLLSRISPAALTLLLLLQSAVLMAHSHGHDASSAHVGAACQLCQLISSQGPVDLSESNPLDSIHAVHPRQSVEADPVVPARALDLRGRGPPLHLL